MSTGSSGFCTLQRGPKILQNRRGMLAIEYGNARRSDTEPTNVRHAAYRTTLYSRNSTGGCSVFGASWHRNCIRSIKGLGTVSNRSHTVLPSPCGLHLMAYQSIATMCRITNARRSYYELVEGRQSSYIKEICIWTQHSVVTIA